MSAKETAIHDILEELRATHKSFIAFRSELNPVMRNLVKKQIKKQKQCQSSKNMTK